MKAKGNTRERKGEEEETKQENQEASSHSSSFLNTCKRINSQREPKKEEDGSGKGERLRKE